MHVTHVQAYASPFQKSERQVLGWLFQHDLINSSKEHSQKSSTNDRWELNQVALTLLNSCLPGKAVLNNIKCVWSMWNGRLSHNSMMDTRKEKSHGFDAIVEKNNTYSVKEANSPAHCVGVCIFIERYPVICLDEHWKRVQCTENKNGFLIVLLF